MTDKTIKMYISCTWKCNPDACRKKARFFNQHGLKYEFIEPYNEQVQIINGEKESFLEKRMKQSDCLLILNGVEQRCEIWLEQELKLATKFGVPVVAISPWTDKRSNTTVVENAHINVGWHGKLITEAISSLFD